MTYDEPSDKNGALLGHVEGCCEICLRKLGYGLTRNLALLRSIYLDFVMYYSDMKVDLACHTMPASSPSEVISHCIANRLCYPTRSHQPQ